MMALPKSSRSVSAPVPESYQNQMERRAERVEIRLGEAAERVRSLRDVPR